MISSLMTEKLDHHLVQRFDDTITRPHTSTPPTIMERRFSPYVNNGGTILAIAGTDFAVCVSDTRLSTGFRIHTRQWPKYTQLTDKCIIASSGMQADITTLHKVLLHEVRMYEHTHRRAPSIEALSQLLHTVLYHKRFFPYYAFNALIGLDGEGKGAIYDYDAIGSFQRNPYSVRGTGTSLAASILDNQIGRNNQLNPRPPFSKVETIDLAKDVITSVCERDIFTGDEVDVIVIDSAGSDQTIHSTWYCKEMNTGKIFVPATREERLKGQKVIIILDQACLEMAENAKHTYGLLNSQDHRNLLKKLNREIDDVRPDITHQCLITLLDSPLNRSGKLVILIRTSDRQLIEISPHLTIPKTWIQFQAMMVTFLQRRSIKAQESNVTLLRYLKNRINEILPPGSHRYGLSVSGTPVNLSEFCEQFRSAEDPIVFFIGAVAKSDPTSKENCQDITEALQISDHHLTAAICCGKICNEFENLWNVF